MRKADVKTSHDEFIIAAWKHVKLDKFTIRLYHHVYNRNIHIMTIRNSHTKNSSTFSRVIWLFSLIFVDFYMTWRFFSGSSSLLTFMSMHTCKWKWRKVSDEKCWLDFLLWAKQSHPDFSTSYQKILFRTVSNEFNVVTERISKHCH